MPLLRLSIGLALFAIGTLTQAAPIYKWTDAQGVTHFSADPPPAGSAEKIKIKGANTDNSSTSNTPVASTSAKPAPGKTDKAAPPATKTEKKDDSAAKPENSPERYAERCKNLQNNLQTMQQSARIRIADEKGEMRVLTEEEKQEKLDDTQRQIKAFCE